MPLSGEITIGGYRITGHYYAGEKPATRIRLNNGAELTGATASHRVLTSDGWRLMAELQPGDLVVGRFVAQHTAGGAVLPTPDVARTRANEVRVPERMSANLATFLGMIAADGHLTEATGAVGLTTISPYVEAEFVSSGPGAVWAGAAPLCRST